jgi:hypothetical protein
MKLGVGSKFAAATRVAAHGCCVVSVSWTGQVAQGNEPLRIPTLLIWNQRSIEHAALALKAEVLCTALVVVFVNVELASFCRQQLPDIKHTGLPCAYRVSFECSCT